MTGITVPPFIIDLVLLVARLILAITFIAAGRGKWRNIAKAAKQNELPQPVTKFLATAEIAGGLGMLFGVLTQYAAIGLMLLMASAISLHIFRWKSPYWAQSGGWEYDLTLFTLAAFILVNGGGRFALLNG